ncbi:3-oxoacyl-[acyl-carrier-protein] synthase III C-terminal domain-containing protein [Burkholderia sp. BE12]|uniref:3-oxoacyl-[acyl-carrier-protein] synthase III C-terminal domain-containing protein n=1 Tax=Burkholderia sp. BE12 TaxID=2082394 RepID=UPI000CF3BB72|nr:3-oxoacyl-[acyl-carrier-protein] synthase III C-terminal domain-containing protein [Burkholderia sp. BE12]
MFHRTDSTSAEPRIVATAQYVPLRRHVDRAVAETISSAQPSALDTVMHVLYADTLRWRAQCAPCGDNGSMTEATFRPDNRIATETNLSLSDMALRVARMICPTAPARPAPDQIIVCTTSFEHDLALSCAGRLHCELGSSRAPFAIGQLQDVSFLTAVDVALAMMNTDTTLNTVLIVAAECWHRALSQQVGARISLADGAAAVLIARSSMPGWRVRGLSICTPGTQLSCEDTVNTSLDSPMLVGAINKSLSRAALRAAQIDWILPSTVDSAVIRTVCARCQLAPERVMGMGDGRQSHLCAAQTPARLDDLLGVISPRDGQRVLVWSTGFQGQSACAILEFRGVRS